MNRIVLLGRLTKDPEVKYTNTGKVVCLFTLAVDRPYANQQGQREADFINIVLWGKQAETFGNYFSKGQRALVAIPYLEPSGNYNQSLLHEAR